MYLHNKEKLFTILSNLQTNLFRIDSSKMEGLIYRGVWLIHGTKHREEN